MLLLDSITISEFKYDSTAPIRLYSVPIDRFYDSWFGGVIW